VKILFLGPDKVPQQRLIRFLTDLGNIVVRHGNKLDQMSRVVSEADYLISFGYRHIIGRDLLYNFNSCAINLHISFLPWNRGSDPNLWSVLENTPKGVSIHQIEENLDGGKVFCQREVFFQDDETLRSSYQKLITWIVELFEENWLDIQAGELKPIEQEEKGSYHKRADKNAYENLLIHGWDTKIRNLEGKALHV